MVQVTAPYKTITLGISNVRSYWFAGDNPIVFECERQDAAVQMVYPINANAFFIQIASGITDSSQVGRSLYFNSNQYNGTYEILSVNTGSGVTLIEVSGTYLGTTSNGFINLSADNYYVEFVATSVIDGSTYTDTIRLTPSANGTFNLDMSDIVVKYLANKNSRVYGSGVNNPDEPHTGYFTLKYRTVITYNGTITSNYSLVSGGNPFYFIKGALQFGAEYDSNLANYVPLWGNATLASTEPDVSNQAKFLTKFTKPIYNEGWPFDLSFIYSEALHGQQVQKVELFKDLNGNSVGAGSSFADLDSDGLEYVNQLNLIGTYSVAVETLNIYLRINNTGSDALTAPQTFTSRVRPLIETSAGNLVLPLTSAFAVDYADGYYEQFASGATPDLIITEVLPIEVVQCDKTAPFYLCWLNKLGGYDYYMFEGDQDYKVNTKTTEQYEQYFDRLSVSERRSYDLSTDRVDSFTLYAESIPKAHLNGLLDLLTSSEVYKMEQDGTRKRLLVKDGNFTPYSIESNVGTMTIDVEMPDVL